MSRTQESPASVEVGDLVVLKHDYFRQVGYGIVLHPSIIPQKCVVFWLRLSISQTEFYNDLEIPPCGPPARAL